jgi:hypothetical protein
MGGELMNYYWMYYNITSGILASQHSTHSPVVQTTTVTVGTNAPTVTRTVANTSLPSTSTNYLTTVPVALTGTADVNIPAFTLTDSNGDVWNVASTQLDSNGSASVIAICAVTDKVVSVAVNGLKLSGPIQGLTGVTNGASTTTETVATVAFDDSLLPSGNNLLGPYDDSGSTNMPNEFQSAYDNPQAWLYQNGAYVANPNWPTIQIQQAAAVQIASVTSGLNATLVGGFTSKSTGHRYVTTTNGQTNMEGDLKRFELDSTLTSVEFYTLDASWVAHTHTDLQNAFLDGGKWKDAQYAQARTLTQQIQTLASQSGTTVAQIQAVVWSPATY